MENREFYLWSLLVLGSPGVEGAVMSKIMGRTDPMLSEAMFPTDFQLSSFFIQKIDGKGIFNGKTGNFLCAAFFFSFS